MILEIFPSFLSFVFSFSRFAPRGSVKRRRKKEREKEITASMVIQSQQRVRVQHHCDSFLFSSFLFQLTVNRKDSISLSLYMDQSVRRLSLVRGTKRKQRSVDCCLEEREREREYSRERTNPSILILLVERQNGRSRSRIQQRNKEMKGYR